MLGTLTLATAAWRSPLVPRIVAGFMLDFAAGQGVICHLANCAGFTILAVAVVTGYSRQPKGISRSTQPGGEKRE